MDLDIIETLNEMAQNESKAFEAFNERLIEYCTIEKGVYNLFRVLRGIEAKLKYCLEARIPENVDRAVVKKVLRTIKTELFIIKSKINSPDLLELSASKAPPPAGTWTSEKLNLIELIVAIVKTQSVNNGNVTQKAIQECFEYVFQVKLGNISNRIAEMDIRKEQDKLYLEVLLNSLKNFLDDMNL